MQPGFRKSAVYDFHTMGDPSDAAGYKKHGLRLWKSMFTHATHHKKNHRVTDASYGDFLKRMRDGTVTLSDVQEVKTHTISANHMPSGEAPSIQASHTNINALNYHCAIAIGHTHERVVYDFVCDVTPTDGGAPIVGALDGYCVGMDPKKSHLSHLMLYVGAPVIVSPQCGNGFLRDGVPNGCRGIFVGTYPPLHELETEVRVTHVCGVSMEVTIVKESPEYVIIL